ncbi:hypothetical protein AIOL_000748 [Candidatus Rhodobacter oscarellae]|uniref:Uncharacterized protein n=1 Tax=Candidatus Rhodobacter oscarellae TaxID=1675527 RepID=A0A0J9ED21_9RHOB|nr:hypothetical protein [Candidatus Rhodobacter lobularis]KMW60586.1 hypothetical protein AIOL_000748 [Candidatus Rhodobacter lobularis]
MNLHGLSLIGASAACLGAAAALNHLDKHLADNRVIAAAESDAPVGCMFDGFDTDAGRVGCLVQTSHANPSSAKVTFLDRWFFAQ